MSDTLKIANSIWPNGMKVDSDGHAVFYPLGTIKIKVPTSSSEWPKGNKLVSPFVYDKDDKLVGFVDTKALTTDSQTTIYLPYEHIEAEFSAINKGQLQIHAPNATIKKASWKDSGVEDIPEAQYKYKGCTTINNVKTVDANYQTTDIVDGVWSEPLWDLEDGNPMNNFASGMFYRNLALTAVDTELLKLNNGYGMFYGCTNLTSFSGDLSSLTNGTEMFSGCTNLTTFSADLPSLMNGSSMFRNCTNLTTFTSDLSSLTDGNSMFEITKLKSFSSDLSSMTNGRRMFYACYELTAFTANLSSLRDGYGMFQYCKNLTTLSSDSSGSPVDLSNLTNGEYMFEYCNNLTTFNFNLSKLTNGHMMFFNCSKLTTFSQDLSSLTNGQGMFASCGKLTSFNSNLSSLTDGNAMFRDSKFDTASVQNIADTINTYNGTIHIGIGNSEPNEQEEAAFNNMVAKGWTVYVKVNGGSSSQWNPTALTPIDGEVTITPIPYWAKPVPSDEETATYSDEQGDFYNILGGNYIYGDDISTYGMFTCEEDAAANMRLTPYIKPQTEIENQ